MRRVKVPAQDGTPGFAIPVNEVPQYLFKTGKERYWLMNQYTLDDDEELEDVVDECRFGVGPREYVEYIPAHGDDMGAATKAVIHDPMYRRSWVWIPARLLEPEVNEWGEVAP